MDKIEQYNSERDAILLMDNLAVFIDWALSQKHTFSNDYTAEVYRKKMITACPKLPEALRKEAKQWIERLGYTSWD
jgi:hypothetical protein